MNSTDSFHTFKPDDTAKIWTAAKVQWLMDEKEKVETRLLEKEKILHAKDLKIQALVLELAHLKRMQYGKKNEALIGIQLELFDDVTEDLSVIETELEQLVEPQSLPKAKRNRAGRQPLPDHLPRVEHIHEPESCHCGNCGKDLVKIGEDVTEQLDVEPAKFFVHRHIRPQYACRGCETVSAAAIPPAIIDGGMASVGLLVWILTSKYLDHLP